MKAISVLLGVSLCCAGCRNTQPELDVPFTGIDARNAYSLFAGVTEPVVVPSEVRGLQAAGAVWMDMHVLCRFRAPESVIDSLLVKGYQKTNWEAVVEAMHPDAHYTNAFSPKWNPDALSAKECYLQRVERDHGSDMLYLALDRRSGLVYAVAEGEVHD